jgi:signal peptidase I
MTEATAAPAKTAGGADLLRAHPRASGAAAFLLFQAAPLAAFVASRSEPAAVWRGVALAFMVAAAVPAAALARRAPWAPRAALALAWTQIVAVLLHGMSAGFASPHFVFGGILAGVLVALNALAPRPEASRSAPPAAERPSEAVGLWLKENVEAVVVAFIMALVIRCFCIEVFKIPSSSMEPTLLGDYTEEHQRASACPYRDAHRHSRGGDRIMVTKYYYAASAVERYDVVVFRFPLNQSRNFIKRVVGLPNEELKIHRGNLYVRPLGSSEPFRIAPRTLRTQESVWIPLTPPRGFLADRASFEGRWRRAPSGGSRADFDVQQGELTTHESPSGGRDIAFVCERPGGETDADDLHLEFEFELTSPRGEVFAEIVNAYGRFEVVLATDAESELRWYEPGSETRRPSAARILRDARPSLDHRMHLALSVYDGRAVARVDGGKAEELEFITTLETLKLNPDPDRRAAFGARGATFRARSLHLARDIHYEGKQDRAHGLGEDETVRIPPGHYVMMGDNVGSSHDSRAWVRKRFALADGRVVECEGQEEDNFKAVTKEAVMARYGLKRLPDKIVAADTYGVPWALYDEDPGDLRPGLPAGVLRERLPEEPFRTIPEKFVVGKALWIWWPPGRWFRLIR